MSLMSSRRFAPLFWCQFFSVVNDNFLKNSLVFLIMLKMSKDSALITISTAVLMAPSFILSGLGGELADRYDKAKVAVWLKFLEIGAAALAAVGFALHSVPMMFVALFLFGVVGALFSPIKYGILPDHLTREQVPAGNALVEGGTFTGIVLGSIIAGFAAKDGGNPWVFGLLMMTFAWACWQAAKFIPATAEAAPTLKVDANIVRSTGGLIRYLWQDKRLWWGGLVTSWFWTAGAIVISLLPSLVDAVNGVDQVFTAYLTLFAVAIAIGSGLAAWLAHGRIILLPTVVGAVLIGVFAFDLGWAASMAVPPTGDKLSVMAVFTSAEGWRFGGSLIGLAIGGGLFIVPVFAAVQLWAQPDRRARVIAAVNVINAGFMVVGSLFVGGLQYLGLSTAGVFMLLGAGSFVVAYFIARTMPASWVRDLLSIIFRTFYRLEVRGAENFDKAGPKAVIAANHMSFVDASLVMSLLDDDPVFAIDTDIAKRWWVKPFLRFTRALPVDPTSPMATRQLINIVKGSDRLIIFPEGRLTVTGSLMKVYDGAGLIADKSDAPVVPVHIDGLDKTPYTRLTRDKVRRRLFPKITVTVMEPVKLEVAPELRGKARRRAAGAALYTVMSDMVFRATPIDRTVFQAIVAAAEEQGEKQIAVEDAITGKLTYKRLLTGVTVLGAKLQPLAEEGKAVGVMLPNSNGAAVTILGLMSAGRVPAMINFTAGAANILAACRAAETKVIVTAHSFVEKGKLGPLVEQLGREMRIVYLEDVRATVTFGDKLRGLMQRKKPLVARKPDDPAAILFTSGTEGTPKGVVLSHRNMLANTAQASARLDFGRTDKVFNVLPVFHSFGLTVGLVMPLVSGVPLFLYPSPLHYRIVPELVYVSNATIFYGTDTFLNGYARAAHPYDFRSVRYILAGAEPVKDATRRLYMEKYGQRILEGYGITETSPVAALNTPMFNRFGTVGRLFPGMEARLEPVPGVTEGGRLYLKGPNVMLGYLKADNPGVIEPLADGWHDTGDIVTIDADGYIAIKGRAKRFAKVGGEMISLAAVEALAATLWPDALSAVAAVPDMRKGEKLVLVTQQRGATRAEFMAFAKARGASDLMVPAEVLYEEKLPVLGSGKLDYIGVTRLVSERLATPSSRKMEHTKEPEPAA